MGNVEFESSNDKIMIDKIKFFFKCRNKQTMLNNIRNNKIIISYYYSIVPSLKNN